MTAQELSDILYRRFKGVPAFAEEDALELVEDAMRAHGYAPSDSVKSDEINLILLYAQYQGAWQIAVGTAHYFSFTDGEETVDKTKISENYRKLAKDLQNDYEEEKGKLFGNNFQIMPRIDRPITVPPRRNIRRWRGYRPWRR